jgi:hypothetical protein
MTHRSACIDREIIGATDFDAALEAYMDGGDAEAEELLRTAGNVLGSTIPMDAECAEAIGELTGGTDVLGDYDDALPRRVSLVRLMALPGAKH